MYSEEPWQPFAYLLEAPKVKITEQQKIQKDQLRMNFSKPLPPQFSEVIPMPIP